MAVLQEVYEAQGPVVEKAAWLRRVWPNSMSNSMTSL